MLALYGYLKAVNLAVFERELARDFFPLVTDREHFDILHLIWIVVIIVAAKLEAQLIPRLEALVEADRHIEGLRDRFIPHIEITLQRNFQLLRQTNTANK